MAVPVVVGFEVVNVDHQHRHRGVMPIGAAPLHVEGGIQGAARAKSGQAVGIGQQMQLLLHLEPLAQLLRKEE